ncbi:MAG TPA: GNAT family N-acetyltransferase [Terrimesophilobacter sp.]|nr:GNAT family N-acetyltransferase [Terrimesophilobacter sp.]
MTVTVRSATVEDADALGAVHVQAWRQTYAHLLSPGLLESVSAERRAERWRSILGGSPDHAQVVAEIDGDIVGFAASGPGRDVISPRELQLYSIYLLADHQGSGAGQAMLDAVIGDEPAYLWVAEDNPRAQAFYVRNGFALDGERMVDLLEGEPLAQVRMVR